MNQVNLIPFGDRVLVKQDSERTHSGKLEIADSEREKPLEGVVITVGHGRWDHGVLITPEAEAGERVLFGRYAGNEITVDGEEYLLLRDEEIMAARPGGQRDIESEAGAPP